MLRGLRLFFSTDWFFTFQCRLLTIIIPAFSPQIICTWTCKLVFYNWHYCKSNCWIFACTYNFSWLTILWCHKTRKLSIHVVCLLSVLFLTEIFSFLYRLLRKLSLILLKLWYFQDFLKVHKRLCLPMFRLRSKNLRFQILRSWIERVWRHNTQMILSIFTSASTPTLPLFFALRRFFKFPIFCDTLLFLLPA